MNGRQGARLFSVSDGLSYVDVLDARHCGDGTRFSHLEIHTLQAVPSEKLCHFNGELRAVSTAKGVETARPQSSIADSANTQATQIITVIQVVDLKLDGCVEIHPGPRKRLKDKIEQGC